MTPTAPERWLPIPGWEDSYEVSDLGNVRSLARQIVYAAGFKKGVPERLLKPTVNPRTGRRQVYLWRDNKQHTRRIYTLVALAFIGPRPDGQEVRHLNGIETDDRVTNLAYGTHSENVLDQVRHGTHKDANKSRCKNDHLLDAVTHYADGRSQRKCRTCARVYTARYLAKRARLQAS